MVKIIQATTATDFEAVRQIYYQTWLDTYQNELPNSFLAQLTPASWRPETDADHLLLAKQESELVGLVRWGQARGKTPPAPGELRALYVLPNFQGQGIGSQLMTVVLAKLAPFGSAYVTVLAANQHARDFYQHCGWRLVGKPFTETVPQGTLELVNYVYHFS